MLTCTAYHHQPQSRVECILVRSASGRPVGRSVPRSEVPAVDVSAVSRDAPSDLADAARPAVSVTHRNCLTFYNPIMSMSIKYLHSAKIRRSNLRRWRDRQKRKGEI